MKVMAITVLTDDEDEEVIFREYEDGTITKIVSDEETDSNVETESSFDEIQTLINTGKYEPQEMTFIKPQEIKFIEPKE